MRDFLFRGKTTSKELPIREFNNIWVEGDLIKNGDKYYIHPHGNVFRNENELAKLMACYEVIPESVAQFTGLIDKNGKKIFEGDTIRICSSNWWCGYKNNQLEKEKCIVSYNERTACFDFFDGKFMISFDEYLNHDSDKKYSLEVIEDIHDNPELLGE